MAYTKTNWQNGATPAINADNLNHMEQGIYDAQNDNYYTKAEVDAKVDTHNIAAGVTIPYTTVTSQRFDYNYTFPSDGYLVLPINAGNYSKPFMEYSLQLNSVINLETLYKGANPSGSGSQYRTVCLFVKKGMVLSGRIMFASSSSISDVAPIFYAIS